MKKRLLSIITATAMTLSAVPFVVSAEETKTENSISVSENENLKRLTLEDVIELSKKGRELTWSDFEQYEYELVDECSRAYYIERDFYLNIRGSEKYEKPDFIRLYNSALDVRSVFITNSNVEDFINECNQYYSDCDENITWSLDDNGKMTISGNGILKRIGAMIEKSNEIKEIVIEDGITEIGMSAFNNLKNVTSIIIPDTVETIGKFAFQSCDSLKSITIPSSVQNIEYETVVNNAFEEINVSEDNEFYCSLDGILYTKDMSELVYAPKNRKVIKVADTVEIIGRNAFEYANAESVILPDSLKKINESSFKDSAVKNIIIPKSVERVEKNAFMNCGSLEEIVFLNPNCYINHELTTICNELLPIYESDWVRFDGVIKGYFNSTADLYAKDNYFDFAPLEEEYSLKGEYGNNHWTFDDNGLLTIRKGELDMNEERSSFPNPRLIKNIIVEEGITRIGSDTFMNCINVETVSLPNTLTDINDCAFLKCYSLKTINIPSSVKNIGKFAFCGCNSLEEIIIENPMCIIFNSNGTISNIQLLDDEYKYNGVIRGLKGSTAEIYAKTYGIEFAEIKTESIKGDANCDGNVNMADAVLIMQSLANPDKYGVDGSDETHITEQGIANGDMDGNGLTNADALEIQKQLLKISVTDTGEQALFPVVKIHTANEMSQYEEMKKNKPVVIRNEYNPLLSSASGIGILFDFYYPNNSVNLSADKGTFKTWDIEKGSGAVESVGKTYTIENEGYIFWTPDKESIFGDEKIIIHITDSKNVNLGEIVITHDENGVFSAVLN